MEGDRFGLMVDGDIDTVAESHFDISGGTAATREIVDNDFVVDVQAKLVTDHVYYSFGQKCVLPYLLEEGQ